MFAKQIHYKMKNSITLETKMKTNKSKNKNENSYVLSIRPVRGKKKTTPKSISVHGSMVLAEFDQLIRNEMNYDWDHLSGFFMGKPHSSPEIATITPDGSGDNSDLIIDDLNLSKGSELGYVYDFGDDIQSMLRVEEVIPYSINF
jgi:hypothetical protein